MEPIRVIHFSDVLCVWAYVSQARVDELHASLGHRVKTETRFCSVFGNARAKLKARWTDRGGYSGYGAHVRDVVEKFEHVSVHPDVWRKLQPASSMSCHVFLCAVRRLDERGGLEQDHFSRACWGLREAFFRDLRDVSTRKVQLEIAESLGVDMDELQQGLNDGSAHAELSGDYDLARDYEVKVSPTLILNEGRQRLNGNVSYRVIDANVRELLQEREDERASAC